jgi:methionyl-tRNA formyltransferase
MIVAAYGRLLPKDILSIPRHGCLNLHPSLLPTYRGASPIQSAILNGNKNTGVTLMVMAPTFDTGALLAQSKISLDGTETFGDLTITLAELGGEIVKTVLPLYMSGQLESIPQDEKLATYAPKINREDRWLNPKDTIYVNERKVRAFSPEPGAFVMLKGTPIKILQSHLEGKTHIFDTVQPAGKTKMTWAEFLRGQRKKVEFDSHLS